MAFTPVGGHDVLVQRFHSSYYDGDVEVQDGPRGGGLAKDLAKGAIGRETCDVG